MRKDKLETNEVYHILNKSIAGYKIFNDTSDYLRMIELLRYYNRKDINYKYSQYIKLLNQGYDVKMDWEQECDKFVTIIAYCVMPTHIHLILQQNCENGISNFISKIFNSYTRYFNTKHNRKGPLWVGRFKNVLVNSDEQLLHLTRYVHLNPVSSGVIDNPENWIYSSYKEYLQKNDLVIRICQFNNLLDINPIMYKKFVESRSDYQKGLSKIKKVILE